MIDRLINKFFYIPCETIGEYVETKLVQLLAKFEGKLEWM